MTNIKYKGKNDNNFNYSASDVYKIKKLNLYWYIVDILSYRFKRFAIKYQKTIITQYKRESELFNLKDAKNILHIGCGAFPISAMILYEVNGGKIVGIDKNSKFANLAAKLIKKKRLSDRIEIKHGDGISFPLDDFDTIIISGCSVPKIKVLKHIFQTAKPNTKIIVREGYFQNRPVEKLIKSFKDIEMINKIDNHPYPPSGWESFYLIKKK